SREVEQRVAEEPADEIYIQSLTAEKDGARHAVICAGGEALDRLEARIRRELASLIAKYGAQLDAAEVVIIPHLTPKATELDRWMPVLASGLTGLAAGLGAKHAVRVVYGTPDA